MPELLWSAQQCAQATSISRSKWFELQAAGKIPCGIKIGRSRRWRASDVRMWVELGCPAKEQFEVFKNKKELR